MTKRCRNPSQEFDEDTGRCETVSRFLRPCPGTDQERNPRTGYCRRKRTAPAPAKTQRKKRVASSSSSSATKRRRAPTVAQLAATVNELVSDMEVLKARVAAAGAADASLSPISKNSSFADNHDSLNFGDVYPESSPFMMDRNDAAAAADDNSMNFGDVYPESSPFMMENQMDKVEAPTVVVDDFTIGKDDDAVPAWNADDTVSLGDVDMLRASLDRATPTNNDDVDVVNDFMTIREHPRNRRNKLMIDDGQGGLIPMIPPPPPRRRTAGKRGRGGGGTRHRKRPARRSPPHDSIRSPRTYLEN